MFINLRGIQFRSAWRIMELGLIKKITKKYLNVFTGSKGKPNKLIRALVLACSLRVRLSAAIMEPYQLKAKKVKVPHSLLLCQSRPISTFLNLRALFLKLRQEGVIIQNKYSGYEKIKIPHVPANCSKCFPDD